MIELANEGFKLVCIDFVKARDAMMSCTQAVSFITGGITVENGSGYPIPDRSCAWQAGLLT